MFSKKVILFIGLMLLGVAFTSTAQTKKNISKRTEIAVAAATKAIEVNGVILDIYDLKGQLDNLVVIKLTDVANGFVERDPEITLIKDESLGDGAYRLAETLEEAAREADGVNTLKFKSSFLQHNMRTKYN